MITDYHRLLADGVEADDEDTNFHFSRSICKTPDTAIHSMPENIGWTT